MGLLLHIFTDTIATVTVGESSSSSGSLSSKIVRKRKLFYLCSSVCVHGNDGKINLLQDQGAKATSRTSLKTLWKNWPNWTSWPASGRIKGKKEDLPWKPRLKRKGGKLSICMSRKCFNCSSNLWEPPPLIHIRSHSNTMCQYIPNGSSIISSQWTT